MMNGRRDVGERIARAAEWSVVGPLLYRLNVNRPTMRMMARGHVYSDPNWLSRERLVQKMAVVTAPGAWSASIRFVTGLLDPMPDSLTFQEAAQRVQDPILVICGASTPRRSKAEMHALARLANVKLVELWRTRIAEPNFGKLQHSGCRWRTPSKHLNKSNVSAPKRLSRGSASWPPERSRPLTRR
jgi:hypothetical protein